MRICWLLLVGCAADPDPYWDGASDHDDDIALAANKRVAIEPGRVDTAELVKFLPVGRSENGADRRVVMRVKAPGLAKGDRLITPAEVEVTTRCDIGQVAPGCDYNPNVRAQLVLAGGKAMSEIRTITCTRAEHHCKIVFRPSDAMRDIGDLGCAPDCHVELVMWAWHPEARANGDVVIVGSNDGDFLATGDVEQDQGRLMAIRERGLVAADRARRETTDGGSKEINTNANPELVYSHALGDLKAGEQYVIEAKLVTEVSARARFSTEMFLTKNRQATDGNGLDKVAPSAIAEHNGINCTPGTSPCTTERVAVFRVTEDVAGPVYVNIVAKSAVPGAGSARVVVKRGEGFVRSVRYAASFGQ
jgi:hypothetical protein